MKRYVFVVMLFFSCLFVGLTMRSTPIEAAEATDELYTVDPYDHRKLTITVQGVNQRAKTAKVYEFNYCYLGSDPGCVKIAEQSVQVLHTTEYSVQVGSDGKVELEYTVAAQNDGIKNIMVVFYADTTEIPGVLFSYELSTLAQRIILNPDGNGRPLHRYDNVEYSSVRNIPIIINLTEEEKEKFSGKVYIGEENGKLNEFDLYDDDLNVSLLSYGDGEKKISFYFVKKGQTVIGGNDLKGELNVKAQFESKSIYLDTVGPKIYVDGAGENWVWVYLERGEKYVDQKPVCKDAVFEEDSCDVKNDLDVAKIDYSKDGYQFVTYRATDRLGNVNNITAKIKIEIDDDNKNGEWKTWGIIAGSVMVLVSLTLGYVLIKNNEKKKKISYI